MGISMLVALLALGVSSVSLGWQIWSWQHEGPSVRVHGHMAFIPAASGEIRLAVGLTASNRGRSSIQVVSWGFELPDHQQLFSTAPYLWNPRTPHTLEGGHSADWRVPVFSFVQHSPPVSESGLSVRPFVNLGTGEGVKGSLYRVSAGVIQDDVQYGPWT